MLPGVERQQRHRRLRDVAVVVVDLFDDEAVRGRLVGQHAPARALHERGRGRELAVEALERSEVLGDGVGEVALGAAAAVGAHVLPVQRVQDVPGEVEREGLLQAHDLREVALVARLGDALGGVVGALDVSGVVLVVVQFEDVPVDVRFQRAVVVRQVGQRVDGHRLCDSLGRVMKVLSPEPYSCK